MGRLGLGLGLGLGLALGLQLGVGKGFRRNHIWSSIFTPRRNHIFPSLPDDKFALDVGYAMAIVKFLPPCSRRLDTDK